MEFTSARESLPSNMASTLAGVISSHLNWLLVTVRLSNLAVSTKRRRPSSTDNSVTSAWNELLRPEKNDFTS